MLYTYCRKTLLYKRVKPSKILKILLTTVTIISLGFMFAVNTVVKNKIKEDFGEIPYEKRIVIINGMVNQTFSEKALAEEIKRLNIRFPHIVMAQAILESGHFKSTVFRANNNLFGMKVAAQRATTAKSANLGHAYYDTWKESVMDYALFQSAYLRDLRTEADYLEYLDKNYAAAADYDQVVMQVVKDKNLKEIFNEDI